MVFDQLINSPLSQAAFAIAADSITEVNGIFGDGKGIMAFHQSRHSIGVQQRARRIIKVFVAAEMADYEDLCLATIGGANHDIIQHFTEVEVGDEGSDDRKFGKVVRKRLTGQNERESAEFAISRMKEYNMKSGKQIFRPTHCQIVYDAIMATVPTFKIVEGFGTVCQEALVPTAHPVTYAVALADIGTCAMCPPEVFAHEGDQIFIEENPYMKRVKFEEVDLDAERYYRDQMLRWCKGQIGFVEGRKILFEREIAHLPSDVKSELREMFSGFDATIEHAKKFYDERANMSTYKLWKTMGF